MFNPRSFGDSSVSVAFVEGDCVLLRTTMTGTHDGEYKGIPATGRQIAAESAKVFRIGDGMFVGYWCIANVDVRTGVT